MAWGFDSSPLLNNNNNPNLVGCFGVEDKMRWPTDSLRRTSPTDFLSICKMISEMRRKLKENTSLKKRTRDLTGLRCCHSVKNYKA